MAKDLNEVFQDQLTVWATGLSEEIRANLVSKDAWFDQSTLAQSIHVMPTEITATGFLVRIVMPEYAQFVDKGRGATKNRARSISGTVQRKLEGASGWIARRAIPPPMVIQVKRKNSNGEVKTYTKRFKNINEANRSLSFAISQKIHKHGYKSKGYGFYSEIFNDGALTELSKRLEPLLGEQIEVQLIEGVE